MILAVAAVAHVGVFLAMKDFSVRTYIPHLFGGVTPQNFVATIQYSALPINGKRRVVEKQFIVPSKVLRTQPDPKLKLTPPVAPLPSAPVGGPSHDGPVVETPRPQAGPATLL
jgi:hypothetical protein